MHIHPLSQYTSIADAIIKLFQSSVEVVNHEIQTDVVYYIANPKSGRKAGAVLR